MPRPLPSREVLRSRISYERTTGLFYNRWGRLLSGTRTFRRDGAPEAILIGVLGKQWKAHRLAWRLVTGHDPGRLTIDHINRDPFDNRWENLRLADNSLQSINRAGVGRCPVQGVTFHRGTGKWIVRVKRRGVVHHIGTFDDMADAIAAQAAARIRLDRTVL